MLKCWEHTPDTRPTFSLLVTSLSKFLDSMAGYMDIARHHKGREHMEDSRNLFSRSSEPMYNDTK